MNVVGGEQVGGWGGVVDKVKVVLGVGTATIVKVWSGGKGS